MGVINSLYLFRKSSFSELGLIQSRFNEKVNASNIEADFFNKEFSFDGIRYFNVLNISNNSLSEPLNFTVDFYVDDSLYIKLIVLESDYSLTPILINEYGYSLLVEHLKELFNAEKVEMFADDNRDYQDVYKDFYNTDD